MVESLVIDAAAVYRRPLVPVDPLRSWDLREGGKRQIFVHCLWLVPLLLITPSLGWLGLLALIPVAIAARSIYRQQHTRVELKADCVESWVNGHCDLVVERATICSVGLVRLPAPRHIAGVTDKTPC